MLGQVKRAWRFFMAAPAVSLNAKNRKAAFLKLYQTDPATRDLFDNIGLNPEMLKQPDFDLRSLFRNLDFKRACVKAMGSEEDRELLARAATLAPGSEELQRLHDDLLERFGEPAGDDFLRSLPLK